MVKTVFLMSDPYLQFYTDHFSPASTHKPCLHTADIHFHSPIQELSGTICRFMSYPKGIWNHC